MKTVKYGIIGVGNMGSGHLKLFMEGSVENAVVTAIADISELKRNKVKEGFYPSTKNVIYINLNGRENETYKQRANNIIKFFFFKIVAR